MYVVSGIVILPFRITDWLVSVLATKTVYH